MFLTSGLASVAYDALAIGDLLTSIGAGDYTILGFYSTNLEALGLGADFSYIFGADCGLIGDLVVCCVCGLAFPASTIVFA